VCEAALVAKRGGSGSSPAVACCTALAALATALGAAAAVLVAGVGGGADGLAEALARGGEGVLLGHPDVSRGEDRVGALDGAADDNLVLRVAAVRRGGVVVALKHEASLVGGRAGRGGGLVVALGLVAAGAGGGGGLVVVVLVLRRSPRRRGSSGGFLLKGVGEHLDEVWRVDGGEGDALDQHAGLAEHGEDAGQLDEEVAVGAERLQVGLGHLVVVHRQARAVVVGDAVRALDEDVDLVDRDRLLGVLVDEGALADSAGELLGEEAHHVLGEGAVDEGADDGGQGGVVRLGHLEVVGVVGALHTARALQSRVLGGALLAHDLVHRVDRVLHRHHALELAEAVADDRGEQDLLAVSRHGGVADLRGTAGMCNRGAASSAGGAGLRLVGELLCEGEQRRRLHVQRSPDAGRGLGHLSAHAVDVAGLGLLELGAEGADHGVLGRAHGLEVAGLGGVGGGQLVLDGGDLRGVLGAQEVHGVVARLSHRRVVRGQHLEERADDSRVGGCVADSLEELEEDAVEDGGHHRVRLVLVLEGELGAQRHGATEVDLLHHLLHRRQLAHDRREACGGLEDGLDHGGGGPGEVGEGGEL